jgi:hypothetical protein
VTLAEHASGQLGDQFDSSTSHDDLSVFRFRLTNNTGSEVRVDALAFQLFLIYGISDATNDLSDVHLYEDGNPTPKASSPTIDIDEAAGTGSITFSDITNGIFTIPANTAVDYVLVSDVSNLAFAETLTISLESTNVTLHSGTRAGTPPTNAIHTVDPATVNAQIGAMNDDSYADELSDQANVNEDKDYVYVTTYYAGNSVKKNGGFRFPSINIEPGVKIVNATFSGYLYGSVDELSCYIYGHDTDTAPDFVTN